jgi:hypothetical protein
MNKVAIVIGLLLIAVGLIGYFGAAPPEAKPADGTVAADGGQAAPAPETADQAKPKSKTALIPAVFGTLILMCGTLALEARWRKHAMHAAAAIALIGGLAASVMFLRRLPGLLSGDPAVNPRSALFIGLMALLCLVYAGLAIRSFLAARKARQLKG